ncbi:MAG: acyl-CoA dehydrogenase [Chitinophagia bacterium]|nr:acyl-CoA dehydrogenase [Chitinophagia bacterium]
MSNLSHPIALLRQEQVNLIRTEAASAEKQGKLTKKQLNLVYDQDWFKMLTPVAYGGKQMSLPDALQVQEALACADGSLGWVVTLCAGAGWLSGFMDPTFAKTMHEGEKVVLAGSGAITGTAEVSGNDYIITGKWAYASGSNEATAFTANCIVTEGGKPAKDENGKNKIVSVVLMKPEVTVANDWNAMGMVATASNSFEVKDLKVSGDRVFNMHAKPVVNSPLYYYPFLQLAEATLTANLCGLTYHFLDLFKTMVVDEGLGTSSVIDAYETLSNKFFAARQKLYYAVDMSWQVCAANKEISQSVLYKVSVASSSCVEIIRNTVNSLYPYCGLKAANKDMEINRVWRDLHTAGQHNMLVPSINY